MARHQRGAFILGVLACGTVTCGGLGPLQVRAQTSPSWDLSRYPSWFHLVSGASSTSAADTLGGSANGITVGPDWQGIPPSFFDPEMVKTREFRWWWSRFYPRAYPLGYIPDGADTSAWAALSKLKALQSISVQQPGERWVQIGPAPITEDTKFFSGRIEAIAARPGNPAEWLVGSTYGGVWKTTDSGATWRNTTDNGFPDGSPLPPGALEMGAIAYGVSDS